MSRDIVAALCPLAGYACTLGLGGVVAHPLPTPINMTAHARSRFMPCPPSVELAFGQASDDDRSRHRNYLAGLAELRKLASEVNSGRRPSGSYRRSCVDREQELSV